MKSIQLLNAIEKLEQGNGLTYYPYNNRLGKNVSESKFIKGATIIIIEGIHSFHEIIRTKMDLKIFLDAESEVLKKLRYNANINKRGCTVNEASENINKEIEEYNKYIFPNIKYSDLIIELNEEYRYKIK